MQHMDTVDRTPEVHPHWLAVLKEQGRTMTWLSMRTQKSYPMVKAYADGRSRPPKEWLDKVAELLGVPVS
jgi:lambda repressor-like predicted transcriptional regulator